MSLAERVLVTGGAGLIGSHVAELLLERGHEVTIYDNFSTGSRRNLAHLEDHPRLAVVEGDILEAVRLQQLVAQHGYVFHLAAALGVASVVRHPLRMSLTNVRGTENVLAACSDLDRGVLIASTSEVYGKGVKVPFAEDDDRLLGPTTVTRWAYATAKALDEHLGLGYHARGTRVTILRYFNTYGPRMYEGADGQVMARFIRQALAGEPVTVYGDGEQTRCFTYVTDTARITVAAAESEAAVGEVLNVGSDVETSINELAAAVIERTGSRSTVVRLPFEDVYGARFEETRRRVPDLAKLTRLIGERPTVDLRDGIERSVAWARGGSTAGVKSG